MDQEEFYDVDVTEEDEESEMEDFGEEVEDDEDEIVIDEEDPNLVRTLQATKAGKELLKKITEEAFNFFEDDWEASRKYREDCAARYRIFAGALPKKDYPFEGAANAHVPMTMENVARLHSRMFIELFGPTFDSFFTSRPLSLAARQRANVTTKHSNWQFRHQIPGFRRQMARGLLMFLLNGDVVCCSGYDEIRGRNRHDMLSPDEFVKPFVTSVEPDFSDMPHYSHVRRYYKHELEQMDGIWANVRNVTRGEPSGDEDELGEQTSVIAEMTGVEPKHSGKHGTYRIIRYEGWCDLLPGQMRSRWIKLVYDHGTQTPLLLQIHEEEDWRDRIRYQREEAELSAYREARTAYEMQIGMIMQAEDELNAAAESETFSPIERAEAEVNRRELVAQATPTLQEPPAPGWMVDPSDDDEMPRPPKRVPVYLYSHGVHIEPLEGANGMGYGSLLADLNRAANVSLSQFSDSAHLSNQWSILTPSNFDVIGGFQIAPGRHNKVANMSAAEMKDSVMELKPAPANPQLFDIVRFCVEQGEGAAQSPGVLSGDEGKSGETWRGIAARVEQATKQLSYVTTLFAQFAEQIIKNNAKLNAIFLPEEELVMVASDEIEDGFEGIAVRREYYEQDYQIEFRSDLQFTTKAQRIAEADEVAGMANTFPQLTGDDAFVHAALTESLTARGKKDILPALGPRPQPPQSTFGRVEAMMEQMKAQQMAMQMQAQAGMGPPAQGGGEGGGEGGQNG